MVDLVPAANFDWLANLGKVIQEKQQKEALKQAYATPGLGYEEMARKVGAAGDAAGAMNLLKLGEEAKGRAQRGAEFQQTFGLQQRQEERAGGQFEKTHGLAQAVETRRAGESERDFQHRVEEAKRAGSQFQQTFKATEEERERADERKRIDLERQDRADLRRDEPEAVRLARAAGLVPGTEEFKNFIIQQGRAQKGLSNEEQKIVTKAENDLPALDQTIRNVERALELNPLVYHGLGATARGKLGDWVHDDLIPDQLASPEKGAATRRWSQLMSAEAIKDMSETLKGASTDREMAKYLEISADVNNSPKVREEAMTEFLKRAKAEREVRTKRLDEVRRGNYFKVGGGSSTPAAPRTATGGLRTDPDALEEARSWVRSGKPVEEVRKRLIDAGINPSGL